MMANRVTGRRTLLCVISSGILAAALNASAQRPEKVARLGGCAAPLPGSPLSMRYATGYAAQDGSRAVTCRSSIAPRGQPSASGPRSGVGRSQADLIVASLSAAEPGSEERNGHYSCRLHCGRRSGSRRPGREPRATGRERYRTRHGSSRRLHGQVARGLKQALPTATRVAVLVNPSNAVTNRARSTGCGTRGTATGHAIPSD